MTEQQRAANKITEELLDLLLDDVSGPLVDESTEHFDIIGPMLRRPDIGKFIAGHIALALELREPKVRPASIPPEEPRHFRISKHEVERVTSDLLFSWFCQFKRDVKPETLLGDDLILVWAKDFAGRALPAPEAAKDVYPAIEDVLDKYCRGSVFTPTTRENVAEVLDRILKLDAEHVQELQKLKLAAPEAAKPHTEACRIRMGRGNFSCSCPEEDDISAAALPEARPSQNSELLAALKDAVQTARNYYALFHDETWKERVEKWETAVAKAEARPSQEVDPLLNALRHVSEIAGEGYAATEMDGFDQIRAVADVAVSEFQEAAGAPSLRAPQGAQPNGD